MLVNFAFAFVHLVDPVRQANNKNSDLDANVRRLDAITAAGSTHRYTLAKLIRIQHAAGTAHTIRGGGRAIQILQLV